MIEMFAVTSQINLSNQAVRDVVFEAIRVAQELGISPNFEAIRHANQCGDIQRLIELYNCLDIVPIPGQTWV